MAVPEPNKPTVIPKTGLYTLINRLNNPGFENTGWVANSSCTVAFDPSKKRSGSYSLKVSSTSANESLIVTTDTYKMTTRHIYYVRVYMYEDTAGDVGSMQCYWPIAEPYMGTSYAESAKAKTWQMMSWRNTRSNWSTGAYYQFRFDFENMASGKVAWVDDAMLIDLTECFGSGNEPDKTWCDSNIPYFEKTYIYGTKLSIKTSTWKDLSSGLVRIPTIPRAYTPLEYIESTGTQYIDTDFKPKTTSRIQMRVLPTKTVSSYTAFFGCRTDSSPTASDSFSFAATAATTIRSDYFGTNQSATVSTILADTIIDKKQNILTAYGQTITNKAKTSE